MRRRVDDLTGATGLLFPSRTHSHATGPQMHAPASARATCRVHSEYDQYEVERSRIASRRACLRHVRRWPTRQRSTRTQISTSTLHVYGDSMRMCTWDRAGARRALRSPPRRRSARGLKQQKRTRRWRTPNPGSRLRTCNTDDLSVAPRTPPPTVPPGGRQRPQIREMTESGRGVWFGVVRWT